MSALTPDRKEELLTMVVILLEDNQPLFFSLADCFSCISAFGDRANDVEFVSMAGLGIAMKNGRDIVKVRVDDITEHTNAEDGAIRYLQRLESQGRLQFASA